MHGIYWNIFRQITCALSIQNRSKFVKNEHARYTLEYIPVDNTRVIYRKIRIIFYCFGTLSFIYDTPVHTLGRSLLLDNYSTTQTSKLLPLSTSPHPFSPQYPHAYSADPTLKLRAQLPIEPLASTERKNCVCVCGMSYILQACTYGKPKFLTRSHPVVFNPLTPELNPSAQRCPTRFFYWDFTS
jgi:hypothetical protein